MKKMRIYVDTSVINFLFADDAPDLKRVTVEFFDQYASQYDLFISRVVLEEVEADPNLEHRAKLLDAVPRYNLQRIDTRREAEIDALAVAYIRKGLFPGSKFNDALHVAYAVVCDMDVLLSWNFKHLANLRKETLIMAANLELEYRRPLRIVSPMEVEYE